MSRLPGTSLLVNSAALLLMAVFLHCAMQCIRFAIEILLADLFSAEGQENGKRSSTVSGFFLLHCVKICDHCPSNAANV